MCGQWKISSWRHVESIPQLQTGIKCPFIRTNPLLKKQWRSKTWTLTSKKVTAFDAKELLSLHKSPLIQLLTLFLNLSSRGKEENEIKSTWRNESAMEWSYRLEHMLQTIGNLSNHKNPWKPIHQERLGNLHSW